MRICRRDQLLATLLVISTGGCAQVRPQADYGRAHELLRESTGASEAFDPDHPPLSLDEIQEILDDGLSLAEAEGLALLNNRELQAELP